jgi:hypothetical protein
MIDIPVSGLVDFLSSGETGFREDYRDISTVDKDSMESGLESMNDKLYRRFCKKHYALIADIETIGLPHPDEQFCLVTRRPFNSVQFIEYIAQKEIITHMKLVVYSINFQAAEKIVELIDAKKIESAEILISNLRNGAHREKELVMKELFSSHPNISLFYCNSHAKIVSMETRSGNYYTISGSGNMSNNSRVEQYVIDNDQGLYEFTCTWMKEIKNYVRDKKEFEQCGVTGG